jgi:hypothetical protein
MKRQSGYKIWTSHVHGAKNILESWVIKRCGKCQRFVSTHRVLCPKCKEKLDRENLRRKRSAIDRYTLASIREATGYSLSRRVTRILRYYQSRCGLTAKSRRSY